MAEEKYIIPASPQYSEDIRKLQDSDPASASTVFNPLFQRIIENIAAVKLESGQAVIRLETTLYGSHTLEGQSDPDTSTAGMVGQHYVNTDTGEEFECTGNTDGVYTWMPAKSSKPLQDAMSEMVRTAIQLHNEDLSAHANRRHVIATRVRDPARPTYGLEPGGGGEAEVLLIAGPYTGRAEVSAVISGVEYDANNMSAGGEDVPNGTLILTKLEE